MAPFQSVQSQEIEYFYQKAFKGKVFILTQSHLSFVLQPFLSFISNRRMTESLSRIIILTTIIPDIYYLNSVMQAHLPVSAPVVQCHDLVKFFNEVRRKRKQVNGR